MVATTEDGEEEEGRVASKVRRLRSTKARYFRYFAFDGHMWRLLKTKTRGLQRRVTKLITARENAIAIDEAALKPSNAKADPRVEAEKWLAKAEAEREKAMTERDEAKAGRDKAKADRDKAKADRDKLQEEYNASSIDEKARLEPRLNEAKLRLEEAEKELARSDEQFNRADDFLNIATTRADDYVKLLMNVPKSPLPKPRLRMPAVNSGTCVQSFLIFRLRIILACADEIVEYLFDEDAPDGTVYEWDKSEAKGLLCLLLVVLIAVDVVMFACSNHGISQTVC